MEKQNKAEAAGVVGEVYSTPTSMNIADTSERAEGWKQADRTVRVLAKSHGIGTHQPWWVWVEAR